MDMKNLQIALIVALFSLAVFSLLSSCTINVSFSNISTNGKAEDLVDTEEQLTNSPQTTLTIPAKVI